MHIVAAASTGVTTLLENVGEIVTSGMSWLGSAVTEVTKTGNELLLVFVCVGFIGTGIGLMRRIIG